MQLQAGLRGLVERLLSPIAAICFYEESLLLLRRRHVRTALVQYEPGDAACFVYFECDLRVNDLVEELRLRFRENLKFFLPGRLFPDRAVFDGNRKNEIWRQLIVADVGFEDIRRHLDFGSLGRRFPKRYGGVDQGLIRCKPISSV